MNLVSQYKVCVDVYVWASLDRERQTTLTLSTMAILDIKPELFQTIDIDSFVGIPLIPKHATLNDLEWLFYVRCCFCACDLCV